MTETLAYESTQQELSNKNQHDMVLHPFALDESSLSIEMVRCHFRIKALFSLCLTFPHHIFFKYYKFFVVCFRVQVGELCTAVAVSLPPGYLSYESLGLGRGNAGPDIKWVDGGKQLFRLNLRLVSTTYTKVRVSGGSHLCLHQPPILPLLLIRRLHLHHQHYHNHHHNHHHYHHHHWCC